MATRPKPVNQPVLTNDQAYATLDKAQQLITMGWTKNMLACNQDGRSVPPQSERAVKWCELGALQAATYYLDNEQEEGPAYKYVLSVFNAANVPILAKSESVGSAVPFINDHVHTTHEHVIRMFIRSKAWLLRQQAKQEVAK